MPVYYKVTIMGGAMAEGFGLFGAAVSLVTDEWYGLVAAGIGVVVLLSMFPSHDKSYASGLLRALDP